MTAGCANAENGAQLYTALYDKDGKLIRTDKSDVVKDEYNQFKGNTISAEGAYSAKSFIWQNMKPSGKISSENVSELTENRCIRLTGKNANGMQAKAKRSFAPLSGKIAVESTVRVDRGTLNGPYIGNSTNNPAAAVQIFADKEIIHRPGGEWKSAYPCNAGRAYAIKFVIDTDSDTYDLYVDGNKIEENAALLYKLSDISFVSYTFEADGAAYIDDFKIYRQTGE